MRIIILIERLRSSRGRVAPAKKPGCTLHSFKWISHLRMEERTAAECLKLKWLYNEPYHKKEPNNIWKCLDNNMLGMENF